MKTLPDIAVRLTRMISDDTKSLQEFEEVIRLDPTLVLRLLKIVNSPFYALASKVESIAEAVAFVGMDNLRNMIVMDILKNIIKNNKINTNFSRNDLWLHSAAVGICSQLISERIFEEKGENAFLCGLIHDIGLIIEDQIEPGLFIKACDLFAHEKKQIDDCEREILGTDHAKIGFLLSKDWLLPAEVREGIKYHHESINDVDPESLIGIIKISEYLVYRLKYSPLPGMKSILPESLLKHMRNLIQEYKTIAMDLPDELKKADDIFSLNQE
ncbi:MAG: HDOD domain-containing protein [Deltaproteobacteria bacterium]|nr:HDOD domain-containing protein [Deltaproteobacteria bacterium]